MALQKTVDLGGLTATDAYHQVLKVAQSRPTYLQIKMGTFKDEAAASAWETDPATADPPLKRWSFTLQTFDKAGLNAHKQAYVYIKTLEDWSDATDLDP